MQKFDEKFGAEKKRKIMPGIKNYLRINRRLILPKFLCFLLYGSSISLFAYLTIHMRWLGLNAAHIGIIYGLMPITMVFGPPVFGPLADRWKKHRIFFLVFLVFSAILHNLLQGN